MRNLTLFGAILLWATALLAGDAFQPLNVKTGLWQVTENSTMSGLPPFTPDMQAKLDQMSPEQRAHIEAMMKDRFSGTPHTTTYKKCVTAEDLKTNPWVNGPDEKCTWTVVSSTSSDMEVRGTGCDAGKNQGMDTDIRVKLHVVDSENVKASAQGSATGNGHSLNFNNTFTGKWMNANCPAGTD
jgi:hypothetical protein